MLEQIDQQLAARLTENGVRSERLMFKDSPVALLYAETNRPGQSYDRIPVLETVYANRERESALGVQYRLIIIPANFASEGAWQTYDIRWILMDVAHSDIVWSLVTHNRRMVIWRNDENSVRRGQALIDEVVTGLQTSGLLRSADLSSASTPSQ